ncbi:T9SS type A sorting domain-containing protein [Haliscomenobacter sp.]|uniref:T9SS type A sorting domain-containing protein n=1 Tax=Haliscomenobacter sp. TaxID=2717303 RepID=UPI003BA9FF69
MLNSGNSDPDVLLLLGNRNSGRYRLSWDLFVTQNKRAYYNLQHNQNGGTGAGPNWAYHVSFESNGVGYLRIGDQAETAKRDSFNYVNGGWNRVMQIIDLNKNRAELWINDEYVSAWDFNRGTNPLKVLGAVNFYADTNCNYAIDNICLWRALPCQATLIYSPVCLKSGIQYDNSSLAGCDLYTNREFTAKPCANETVCNYGGSFIEIEGPPAQGRLESGLLPNSLANELCVRDVFGNKAPGELYGEIFVFQYDPKVNSSIGIYWYTEKGKSRPFVFKCNCDDPLSNLCFQNCIPANEFYPGVPTFKENLIQDIRLDVTKKALYYVVLLSDTPTNFTLRINTCIAIPGLQEPSPKSKLEDEGACGPCLTNNPIILDCSKPVVNGNLATKGSEFSKDDSAVYSTCAQSNRKYLGEDLVHKFTLSVPSRITLTLNGFSSAMGMFLYNQNCGQNCLATAETSSSGGVASIGPIDLDAGDYYVIVDKEAPKGTGGTTYGLELKCEEDQNPDFQFDETACPTVTTNPHTVRVRAISGLLMDNLSLTLRDKINFVYDKGQGNYVLENGKFWNGQELIFQFFADQTGDGLKCGYAPNDSFNIRIIKDEKNFKVKPVFNSNTSEKFNPGAQSVINRFQVIGTPSNLRVTPAFKELDANATTFPITFKALVQSDIKWEMSGLGSWAQAIRGAGNRDDELTINVLSPNPNATPRLDTLVLLGQNKELRRIILKQKACAAASVNLGEGFSVCQGDRVTLTPQGTGNYTWGDGSIGSTFTFTANVVGPTTYQVKSTVSGCTATSRVTVNVRPKPVVALGDNRSGCAGTPLTISPQITGGTTPYLFSWSTGATSSTIPVSVAGKYTLKVTEVNGCTGMGEVSVNFKPTPNATAGIDQSICPGERATLRASGGTNYRWSNNATGSEISVDPSRSTNYTVTVTQDGCEATDEVGVIVKSPPQANAGLDQIICAGQNAILRASGGTSYRWSNNGTSAEISVSPAMSTIFTVTVTQDGCEAMDEVSVTVKSLPSANAGLDQSICEGQNAILRASGGTSYRWSNNATSAEISVNPAASTNFTVTVAQDGCEATDQVRITVKSLPTANAGLDQSICAGGSAILRATGGTSFRWSNNTTGAEISVNPATSTNFTVTVTQDGCEATDEVRVTVKSLPVANAGLDQIICAGQNAILRATGGISYRWSNNTTGAEISVNPATSTNFTVTVTQDGCEATDQVRVTVKSLPTASAGLDQSICAGQNAILRASGGTSYRWSNNATSSEISVNPATSTNFTVTVTQDGCEATDQVRVTVKSLPAANAGLDQSICSGQNAILRASGGTNYRWSNNASSSEIRVSPGTSTNFTVTVTQDGCEASDQVEIKVNPNPSVIKESIHPAAGESGNIQVRVSGGTPGYQFQWFRNDTLISTQEDLIGLRTGIFKLIVTDANGCKATYGPELVTRTLDLELANAIQVFPNPNDGQFNIQFHLEQNTLIEINILDALGRKVLWRQARRGFKEETLAVDLSTHTPGIYLIQFKTGQLTFYKKIIRQ